MAVLATSTSMTKQMEEKLEQVSCIWYPIIFRDQTEIMLNSKSKFYAISQVFTHKLGPTIWKTNVRAAKIDGTTLET